MPVIYQGAMRSIVAPGLRRDAQRRGGAEPSATLRLVAHPAKHPRAEIPASLTVQHPPHQSV